MATCDIAMFLCLLQLVPVSGVAVTTFSCKKKAAPNESFSITCIITGTIVNGIQWIRPDGIQVSSCIGASNCLSFVAGYTITRASSSENVLQIANTANMDGGNWTCHDGAGGDKGCEIIIQKNPTSALTILSTQSTYSAGDTLEVSVDVQDYYCSRIPSFHLLLDSQRVELDALPSTPSTTLSGTQNKSITVTEEMTGSIKLVFNCRDDDVLDNRMFTTTATTPAIQTGPTAPSTGTQERNDLDCSGGRMRIHVPQTLLPTHIVTLRDPSCKVASNGSHLLADVGVNECGTTVSFTNDSVIFTNELVATALSGTTAPTIIDYGMNMKDQRVKISCIYPRENRVDFSYVPVMKEAHFYERQYGKLSFDVSQYSDEQFSHAIPHNGLPIGVTLNTELFIDISLRHASHKGVGIMVDSCIATPTSSPADPLWYTVIKDGCPAQQDVRTFASPDVDEFRFSFLVFRFTQAPLQKAGPNLPPTSMVFIHCQVSACPSQNCTNTCNPAGSHRVRREAELENSHLVSAGPFYLKSEEERGGYTGGVVAASVSMAVVATLVAIVALVAWRRSVNKLSKHQTLDEAS